MLRSQKIMYNTLILYFRMIITMFITLYISRIVVNALGIERFGLYSVLSSFVLMAGFITSILSVSSQRFLSESLSDKSDIATPAMFKACLSVHIVLSLVTLFIIEFIGLWFINHFLIQNVVSDTTVNYVFQGAAVVFIISILYSPFLSLLLAHENMSAYAWLTIIDVMLRLIAASTIFIHHGDVLLAYVFNLVIASIASAAIGIFYVLFKYTNIKIGINFDRNIFYRLSSYIGWNLWGGLAAVINNQGINILLNRYFGVSINASRAISTQVYSAINQVLSSSQMAFNPQLVKSYMSGDYPYIKVLICRGAKLSVFLTLLMFVILFSNVEYILTLWIGKYNTYAVSFIKLMLIDIFINSMSGTAIMAIQATGKIKLYQSVVGGFLLLNLPISLTLLWFKFDATIVYIVSIIISSICLFMRMCFLKSYFKISFFYFLNEVVLRSIVILGISYLIVRYTSLVNSSFSHFILNVITEAFIVIFFSFIALLNSEEKKYLFQICKKLMHK